MLELTIQMSIAVIIIAFFCEYICSIVLLIYKQNNATFDLTMSILNKMCDNQQIVFTCTTIFQIMKLVKEV